MFRAREKGRPRCDPPLERDARTQELAKSPACKSAWQGDPRLRARPAPWRRGDFPRLLCEREAPRNARRLRGRARRNKVTHVFQAALGTCMASEVVQSRAAHEGLHTCTVLNLHPANCCATQHGCGSVYFKIKQIGPWRLREVQRLVRGHTATQWKAGLEARRVGVGDGCQWVPTYHAIGGAGGPRP